MIKIIKTSNFNFNKKSEWSILNNHIFLIINMIKNGILVSRLENTSINGFERSENSTHGLHAMQEKTSLDGLENYFTTDIVFDKKNCPGKWRALWSCKINSKGRVKSVKFFGIVDTHKSKTNLIPLNEIDLNDTNKYIQVKVTDRITKIKNIVCVLKYDYY
jgi:hypothetical protein